MKIRVKGRHLTIFAGFTLLAAVFLYTALPGILYRAADAAADEVQTERIYSLLIDWFPSSDAAAKALYFSAEKSVHNLSVGGDPGMVYFFNGSTGMGGIQGTAIDIAEAVERLETIRKHFSSSPWNKHALGKLGIAYYMLGKHNMAVDYLRASIEESGADAVESTRLLIKIYLEQGDYPKALQLADRSLAEKPGFNPLEIMLLRGRALIGLQQWEEARQVFRELPGEAAKIYGNAPDGEKQESVSLNIGDYEKKARGYLAQIDRLEKSGALTGTVAGTVLVGGKPVSGVHVFLIDRDVDEDYYTGFTGDLRKSITGETGEYRFNDLAPGRYALGVGVQIRDVEGYTLQSSADTGFTIEAAETEVRNIDFVPTVKLVLPKAGTAVDEKATFSWTPAQRAVSYELFMGPVKRDEKGNISAAYTTVLKSGITQNTITVNIKEERRKLRFGGGIAYSGKIEPESVFGLLRPGAEYTWGIYAYDAEGRRISDSSGVAFYKSKKDIPIFRVNGSIGEGDRLLLENRHEEAVKEYEKQIQQNPGDVHALTMLARLYQYGITWGQSDLQKAAGYYERLLAVENTPEVRNVLAQVYFDGGQLQKAETLFKSLEGTSEDSWLARYNLGRITYLKGHPAHALELMEQVVEMEHGIYVRAYPVSLALVLNRTEQALSFAGRVDEGGNYLGLLQRYAAKGYRVRPEAAAAISAGDYRRAQSLLATDNQHDLFVKELLGYLANHGGVKELRSADGIEDPLLAGLLEKMLGIRVTAYSG
nr:tetratricopeptide repeat protein [Phosphitispora fastidiosa]